MTNVMGVYDKIVKQNFTVECFNEIFDLMLKRYAGDQTAAYEATEYEHEVYNQGTRKYKNFESFRVARSRFLTKNRGNNAKSDN